MKKYIFLMFYYLQGISSFSQNLVPNPSFEEYTDCPLNVTPLWSVNTLTKAPPWRNPTAGSSDYLHECGGANVHVPDNLTGFQWARTGQGYMGFYVYLKIENEFLSKGYREYIQVPLIQNLIIGNEYSFEMYVSLADSSELAVENIGALFTTYPLIMNYWTSFDKTSQIINTNGFITDTMNWTLISATFIADSSYNYLTIGNFQTDSTTNVLNITFNDSSVFSYYYVDDVSLTLLNELSFYVPNVFTPNGDGYNDIFTIESHPNYFTQFHMQVFNRWGENIYEYDKDNQGWDGRYNGKEVPEGTYFYVINAEGADEVNYTISGVVTLIR